ncbi:MAG: amidohydrolase [Haliscomenobacter sp.]|nr:amidohydrolase [Haliscomenobacter sp.]
MQSCQNAREAADVLYLNAVIWTGDSAQPAASVLAVKGDKILYVGGDANLHKGPRTRVVDLEGRFVVPGFIDNHTHFLSGGFQLASVDLRSAKTPQEFIQRLADFARNLPEGRWITGGDWDHETWGGELPKKEWIDSVTARNPVFVNRLDGHMALANSLAMRLAKVGKQTKEVAGGTIVRDSEGSPTGIFKDEAMGLIYPAIPEASSEALDEALVRAMDHALSLGVTQVHDVGSYGGFTDLETYQRNAGKLKVRIYSMVPVGAWARMAEYVAGNGRGAGLLRWGGLKGFVDGSLGSTTAWFYAPYDDEPNTSGLLVNDTLQLREWILKADSAKLHVAVHAIGDRANDWLLGVYSEAEAMNGPRDRRFRIEHAQHLTRKAISQFAELGVIPSMQPYHAIDDGRWAEKRIGPERIKTTYAFRSLLDASAKLTFGSDWTVAPLSPLEGIYAAVTRQTLDGKNPGGWVPQEKISVEEALRCYTANNAYAGFQEEDLGVLRPGLYADLVVLSENLLKISPDKIKEVQVLRTVVGGKEAFIKAEEK